MCGATSDVRFGPQADIPLRHRGSRRLALLSHESSDEFDRHIARIDSLVDLARLDKKRVSRIVGSRRTSFMFEDECPFQDIEHERTGVGMSDFPDASGDFYDIHDYLIAGDR
jgi:hypothetical protein